MKKGLLMMLALLSSTLMGWAGYDLQYVYQLTSTIETGGEYLIVNTDKNGKGYALSHEGKGAIKDQVTVKGGYIVAGSEVENAIWTVSSSLGKNQAGNSYTYYSFSNNGTFLCCDGRDIIAAPEVTGYTSNQWTFDSNVLCCDDQKFQEDYYIDWTGSYFELSTSSSSTVYLFKKISEAEATITLARSTKEGETNLNYYATAYFNIPMKLPDDVSAHGVASIPSDATTQTLYLSDAVNAGGVLPANTPVILKVADPSNTNASIERTLSYASSSASSINTNLKGTLSDITAPKNSYKLRKQDGVVAFYRAAGTSILANKAYYVGAAYETASNCLTFSFDDETAIQQVEAAETSEGATYNLAGQQVSRNYRGIVIQNGKKVLRK